MSAAHTHAHAHNTDRQTDRQIDRQTDGQTEVYAACRPLRLLSVARLVMPQVTKCHVSLCVGVFSNVKVSCVLCESLLL